MGNDVAAGNRAIKCLSSLKALPDNSREIQATVVEALQADGFAVETEVAVKGYWGGRQDGRVNIVAICGDGTVAIELDRRSPRQRSAAKLRAMGCYRIIALRGADAPRPDGIHAIVPLELRA